MIQRPRPLPSFDVAWFDPKTGLLTKAAYDYVTSLDAAVRRIIAMGSPILFANLPLASASNEGDIAFVSNGRKSGEGAGAGTGVEVYSDSVHWRAVDTSATVAS